MHTTMNVPLSPAALRPLSTPDVLSVAEFSREEIESLLTTAMSFKRNPAAYGSALFGRTMTMLFEKPSLRTRVSFELGFAKLGGHAMYIDHQATRIGERESASDCAKNLERWTDVIVARVFDHETVQQLAEAADIPVINALSDKFHPCQALADVMTMAEMLPYRGWNGMSIVYVGDGNNVCHSLMLACAILGVRMTVVTPSGYEPDAEIVSASTELAMQSGADLCVATDVAAVANHDVVYTDTWVSMGSEEEAGERRRIFAPYQVTQKMMRLAGPSARFMHCLPAKRGIEVAADVIDSPRSVVFDQAENRMHAQNAMLLHLLLDKTRATSNTVVWPDSIDTP